MRTVLTFALVMSFVGCSTSTTSSSSSGEGTNGGQTCPTGTGNAGLCVGSHTPKTPAGKCEIPSGCQELAQTDAAKAESQCKNNLGTWFPGQRCPTQNLVGRCLQICGRSDEFVVFAYSDDEYTWCNQCREGEGVWLGK